MQDMSVKKKVLEEIMGLMDEKEGDRLKSHPKLMAAKIEVAKPELEKSPHDASEDEEIEDQEEMNPEMIQKILEMYEDMK